jgi:metal-sulfur cluster biosynthetic enzyme
MSTPGIDEQTVLSTLRQIVDPELGFNIVDLGFIYNVQIEGGRVGIQMTLTTPGCPMHQSLTYAVRRALLSLEPVQEVDVELVWEPPWTPEMMSEEVRTKLAATRN